jgi:hypothetical protein
MCDWQFSANITFKEFHLLPFVKVDSRKLPVSMCQKYILSRNRKCTILLPHDRCACMHARTWNMVQSIYHSIISLWSTADRTNLCCVSVYIYYLAGEGDYYTSLISSHPMAVFVDQNEGLSYRDIYSILVQSQNRYTSSFLRSQTCLNLTKYIENNINSYISN